MSGRRVCRAAGHPYHELFSPPLVPGICDLDGSELYQRSDDRPETIRARMAQQLGALEAVVDHYRQSGVLRDVNGLQAIDAVGATSRPPSRRPASPRAAPGRTARRLMHVTRKSRAEIGKMRSAGRIVAEVLALVEEHLEPGISTAELDRLAERHIRAAKGVPSFLNYLGGRRYDARDPHAYPASTCISIDDEIVHGIPGDREIRAGQLVSVDVGVIYDGWHGDGARTFVVRRPGDGDRRGPRPGGHDPAGADGRRQGLAPGQLHRRHLGRGRGRRRAGRLRDHPPVRRATASAPRCTRTRRSRTSGRAPRASSSSPGCASRSSRCSRSARRRPGRSRRLDGRDLGRVARGPLRAHRRDHGRRARDPHHGLMGTTVELSKPPAFDILRVRVSARPGRHSC